MERSRVAIVIPALDESGTISEMVRRSLEYGICIVVDDGSRDDTGCLAEGAGAVVVSHQTNRGYDAALNSGFAKAADMGCDVVLTLDADGQHDPYLIGNFISHISAGAGVVVGARNKKQRIGEYIFGWYSNLRFGIPDPLCGLKAYRTQIYQAQGYFDSFGSIGTELMFFAAQSGCSVTSLTIDTRKRGDQPRFGSVCSANYRILRAMLISAVRPDWRRKLRLARPSFAPSGSRDHSD